MNRVDRTVGPVFLGVAVALFVAFHFFRTLTWDHGWQFWAEAFDAVVNQPTLLKGMAPSIAVFATFSAGVVFSPFAIPLIRKSLLMRWFIAIVSSLVFLFMLFVLLVVGPFKLHAGGFCVLLCAGCNFTGILLSRYEGRHQEALRKLSGN